MTRLVDRHDYILAIEIPNSLHLIDRHLPSLVEVLAITRMGSKTLHVAIEVLEASLVVCPQELVRFQISSVSYPTVAPILAQIRGSSHTIPVLASLIAHFGQVPLGVGGGRVA